MLPRSTIIWMLWFADLRMKGPRAVSLGDTHGKCREMQGKSTGLKP
jgi:hypothetical protein